MSRADCRPALEVDLADRPAPAVPPLAGAVDHGPPGRDRLAAVAGALRRARHRYALAIGLDRGWRPRRHPVVEHRVAAGADEVVARLAVDGADARTVRAALRVRSTATTYDPVEHEHRLPARLELPWSWPQIPVWLGVAERSTACCSLRVSLRTRRRARYPLRYYGAAHAVLGELVARLERAGH